MARRRRCAYCLEPDPQERDHAIPACLYPESRGATSRVQRVTVPACSTCNRGWADDEPHFRNVLLLAAEPNAPAHELWETTVRRSFQQTDGQRRRLDLARLLQPVIVEGRDRWMIYPGHDDRVLRIVRKVVRGLSHFHGIESGIGDERVWADILKYRFPAELLGEVRFLHREADICRYWFEAYATGDQQSVWLLTFFERVTFLATVQAHGTTRQNRGS